MATADVDPIDPEVRTPAETAREPEINKLFRMVMKHEGSDLHLKATRAPMMRLKGMIREMDMKPLSNLDMERLLMPILNDHHRKILEDTGGADAALAASIFHYQEYPVPVTKAYLAERGVPIRWVSGEC